MDAAVSEPETYWDCLSGERAMCQGRIEVMSCAEIEKRKGSLNGQRGLFQIYLPLCFNDISGVKAINDDIRSTLY